MYDSQTKITPAQRDRLTHLAMVVVGRCVSQPEAVSVTLDQQGETLRIELDHRDKARLIGRSGQTINALEEVLSLGVQLIASAENERVLPKMPVIEIRSAERADH